jgi:hypothetical protein
MKTHQKHVASALGKNYDRSKLWWDKSQFFIVHVNTVIILNCEIFYVNYSGTS